MASGSGEPSKAILGWCSGVAGLAALSLGVLLLTTWEVSLFRFTTFERDFSGLECGTPLDNPGWTTGSPCHGAVNRQTGAAWILTLYGFAAVGLAIVVATVSNRARRLTGRPR